MKCSYTHCQGYAAWECAKCGRKVPYHKYVNISSIPDWKCGDGQEVQGLVAAPAAMTARVAQLERDLKDSDDHVDALQAVEDAITAQSNEILKKALPPGWGWGPDREDVGHIFDAMGRQLATALKERDAARAELKAMTSRATIAEFDRKNAEIAEEARATTNVRLRERCEAAESALSRERAMRSRLDYARKELDAIIRGCGSDCLNVKWLIGEIDALLSPPPPAPAEGKEDGGGQ